MTCVEVKGRGEQKGITLEYRGKTVQVDVLPKLMIELVTKNEDLNTISLQFEMQLIRIKMRW